MVKFANFDEFYTQSKELFLAKPLQVRVNLLRLSSTLESLTKGRYTSQTVMYPRIYHLQTFLPNPYKLLSYLYLFRLVIR